MMVKANLLKKQSSFLSMGAETDDVDEDDFVPVPNPQAKVNKTPTKMLKKQTELGKEVINFAEISSKSEKTEITKPKNKNKKTNYFYTKPNDSPDISELNRIQIFRNTQMKGLQQSHTWNTAPRETINEKFNKNAAALGKKNTDEFVTFLGFLRDASYRASKVIAQNDERKLAKSLA